MPTPSPKPLEGEGEATPALLATVGPPPDEADKTNLAPAPGLPQLSPAANSPPPPSVGTAARSRPETEEQADRDVSVPKTAPTSNSQFQARVGVSTNPRVRAKRSTLKNKSHVGGSASIRTDRLSAPLEIGPTDSAATDNVQPQSEPPSAPVEPLPLSRTKTKARHSIHKPDPNRAADPVAAIDGSQNDRFAPEETKQ
jgi:hypothetical protein